MSFEKRESLFYRYEKSFHEIIYVNLIGSFETASFAQQGTHENRKVWLYNP